MLYPSKEKKMTNHSKQLKHIDFIHIGTKTSRDDILNNIYNRPFSVRNTNKPNPSNVLWTSPYNPKNGLTGWQEWLKLSGFSKKNSRYSTAKNKEQWGETNWHIVPKEDCRILVINTKKDLLKLEKYRFNKYPEIRDNIINYEVMAKDYDAFYITENGFDESQKDNSSVYFYDFYTWECTTCIFFHPNSYMMMTDDEYQLYKEKNIKPKYLKTVSIPPQRFEKRTQPLVKLSPTNDYKNIKPNPKYFSAPKTSFINNDELENHLKNKGNDYCQKWKHQLLEELNNVCPYDATLETKKQRSAYEQEEYETPQTQTYILKKHYYQGRHLINTLTQIFNKQTDTFSIPKQFFEFDLDSNPDILKVLVKFGLNPQNYFRYIKTIKEAKLLLDMGAKLNQKDDSNCYPLHYAKSTKLLKFYIENGAKIEPEDTFTHEQYKYLAKIGVNPNDYNWLHNAYEHNENNLLEPFLQYNADINFPDADGKTPLMHHLSNTKLYQRYTTQTPDKYKDIFDLLRYGANPNAKDNNGKTPLMHTIDAESVKILLAYGADPLAKDNNGKSVLEYVSEHLTGIDDGIKSIKEAIILQNKTSFLYPTHNQYPSNNKKTPKNQLKKFLKNLFNER